MTSVLLDFGRSLWRSGDLRSEWAGLPASGFGAIGQFGIGFFSVFMLGRKIRVTTSRYEIKEGESGQWLLDFIDGLEARPILREPIGDERLRKHGTKVSVLLNDSEFLGLASEVSKKGTKFEGQTLNQICARLAPAIDIDLYVTFLDSDKELVVTANDWLSLPPLDLLKRIVPSRYSDMSYPRQWAHMSEILNDAGAVVGRCATSNFDNRTFGGGIGVVKGLYAGGVPGIAGIVFAKEQEDLARNRAVPDVSHAALARWASRQIELLCEDSEVVDEVESLLLARLGGGYEKLSVGKLDYGPVSYEEFLGLLRRLALTESPMILLHEGPVDWDDDDPNLFWDADRFEPVANLIEIYDGGVPEWIDSIASKDCSIEHAIYSAVELIWGRFHLVDKRVKVGIVDNKKDIWAKCKLILHPSICPETIEGDN